MVLGDGACFGKTRTVAHIHVAGFMAKRCMSWLAATGLIGTCNAAELTAKAMNLLLGKAWEDVEGVLSELSTTKSKIEAAQ